MTWDDILTLSVAILAPVMLIGLAIFVISGGIKSFALKPLQQLFSDLNLHDTPESGDITIVYHTYRGLLVWSLQEEHCIHASPAEARLLLGRLLRFNLTWGMLSYALLFIPLLAIGNYFAQLRSINKQERENDKYHKLESTGQSQ